VLLDPGVDLGEVLVLLPQVVLLREVDEVDDGLGGEELERVDYFDLVSGRLAREGGGVEKRVILMGVREKRHLISWSRVGISGFEELGLSSDCSCSSWKSAGWQ
jgi:hypothetical protein